MTSKTKDPDCVRVTLQYRTATGMAYDLRGGSFPRVTILISPRNDEGPAWHVEAKTIGAEHAEGTGSTRKEALHSAAASWTEQNLGTFDWDEATTALAAVRAV